MQDRKLVLCCEPAQCVCTTGQMCAAYANSDRNLLELDNGFGSILSLCPPSGADEIAELQWAGAIDGYFSMGRRFQIDIRHEVIDNIDFGNGVTSDIRLVLNYTWTVALGPSRGASQADLVAALGETPDPRGWQRGISATCYYATLLEPITGSFTQIEQNGGDDIEIDINGYEDDLPTDLSPLPLLELPAFFMLPQANTNQTIMPIPQDGLAWAPFHPYSGDALYTSVLGSIRNSQSGQLDLSFGEFSTPVPPDGSVDATHLDTCDHLKNFATFIKRGGVVVTSDERGVTTGTRQMSLAVDHSPTARRRYTDQVNINSGGVASGSLVIDDMTATLTVLDPCPPDSNIYTLPPITCGPGGGPNRIAIACVAGELPDIVYDPSTRPDGDAGGGIVYEGNRYIPLAVTSADDPVPVQWQDHGCAPVRLGERCDGNGPPHPYLISEAPPDARTFRVGDDIYRVNGPLTSRVPEPVDAWLVTDCPNDEFYLATKCRPSSVGPDTVRYRVRDGLQPGEGAVVLLFNPDGCVAATQYRPTDTPTADASLPLASHLVGTPCRTRDVLRCDGSITPDIDVGVFCAACDDLTNPPPVVQQFCDLLCGRRVPAGRRTRDQAAAPQQIPPAMQAQIDVQDAYYNCGSCGN